MIYKLKFLPQALKEWKKLSPNVKDRFKKHLEQRLIKPKVEKHKLRGELNDSYKIKLLSDGYRLVYRVKENDKSIIIYAVGKREKSSVYLKALQRL